MKRISFLLVLMILAVGMFAGCGNAESVEDPEIVEEFKNRAVEENIIDSSEESIDETYEADFGSYRVLRVVDGDTIEVDFNGNKEKVRFIGVDTPESVHPNQSKNTQEGIIASDFTKSHLEGRNIGLEFDVEQRDRYGRLLAYIWIENQMFNKTLLEEGFAQIATYPPNIKYVDDFKALQQEAREGNKGFWSNEQMVQSENTNVSESGQFVGSINSDKFHKPGCEWAGRISSANEIWFKNIDDARAQGYQACKVCRP